MTSNIGADKLQKEASFGFQATRASDLKDLDELHNRNKDKVYEDLKKMMRPEFLNRIDKIVVFRALTKKDIHRIIDLQIEDLQARLQKRGVGLHVSTAAKQYLLDNGYDAKNGVRPLRRLIQDTFEDHIALELLDDKLNTGDIVQVTTKKGELTYSTGVEA
jgi:ATP-dependent Clp protease ATP-binding subunit ClpC